MIVPDNHPNPPDDREIEAATILAKYFNFIVEFIIPVDDYKRGTVDVLMNGAEWEIKTPDGLSRKYTIRDQFSRATKQGAHNLVLDGRFTKLPDDFIIAKIQQELQHRRHIKKVLFITKSREILAFSK